MGSKQFCYRLNLGDAMLAQGELSRYQAYLTSIYCNSGQPSTMSAVYKYESRALHCELVLYLSNEFQTVAKLSSVTQCRNFSLQGSCFLAGNKWF